MADAGLPPGPRLSARARALASMGQSAAWTIADEGLRRRAAGEDILLLTLGDPVEAPHPAITAAATAALAAGRTHYSPLLGEPALRAAIAAAEGAAPANVVVLPGAQHACMAVLALIAGEGDAVLLSDPYYATYPGAITATGARPITVRARDDLTVDVAALAAAVTPDTRAILLNSPSNPAGTALTAADYAALRRLCEAHDLWLVVDEVYACFRFGDAAVRAWEHGPSGRTIVVNSLSKSHAMTGFRLGWALAPERLVAALGDWSAAALFGVAQFVQDAGLAALALPPAELEPWRLGFRARAEAVVARVAQLPGVSARMPVGGMFVMLDCRAIEPDDQRLARALLDEVSVGVVPGSGFGAGGRGHVRVSLTPDADTLDRAFDRIGDFIARR